MQNRMMTILLMMLACGLFAQEQTLTGKGFHSGGFGGPIYMAGRVNGDLGVFTGGRGGWVINHTLVIGGGGYSLAFDIETDQQSVNGKPLYLDMSYGGFEMEYIHNPDQLVHWTAHMLLGGGHLYLREHDPNESVADDGFIVFQPGVFVEINVAKWFRLGFGVNYRVAMGVDFDGLTNNEMSGLAGEIIFKFGSF